MIKSALQVSAKERKIMRTKRIISFLMVAIMLVLPVRTYATVGSIGNRLSFVESVNDVNVLSYVDIDGLMMAISEDELVADVSPYVAIEGFMVVTLGDEELVENISPTILINGLNAFVNDDVVTYTWVNEGLIEINPYLHNYLVPEDAIDIYGNSIVPIPEL